MRSETLRSPNCSLCLIQQYFSWPLQIPAHLKNVSKDVLLNIFPCFLPPWWTAKSTLMHQLSLTGFTNTSRIYKSSTVIINKAHTAIFLCPWGKQLFVEFRIMKSSLTYRLWTTPYRHVQCVSTVLVRFHSFKAYQTISLHFPEQCLSHRCWKENRRQIHWRVQQIPSFKCRLCLCPLKVYSNSEQSK